MKRLTKIFFIFLFPLFVSGQYHTFRHNLNEQFSDSFLDTSISISKTTQYFNISPKIFSLSSLSNTNEYYNTYLLGLTFNSNINNRLKAVASYDYLNGDYNSIINNYQD